LTLNHMDTKSITYLQQHLHNSKDKLSAIVEDLEGRFGQA
jgi:hypothetical protein